MNSTNPTISIIIPVYNTEKYLRRCLDSIMEQTYKDFECILVDDGSTDRSGKICDEYATKDCKFKAFHKENGGVSSARNFGLDYATGKYIAFCDADDSTRSNWLAVFIDNIKNTDLVICSYINQYSDNTMRLTTYDIDTRNPGQGWAILEMNGDAGYPWNKFFKASIIKGKDIRFNTDYKFCEDEEFVSHYLIYAKKIQFTKEETYIYNVPNSFGEKYGAFNFNCLMDIYNHMLKFIPRNGFYHYAYSSIITRLLTTIIPYYRQGLYHDAKGLLQRICKIYNSFPIPLQITNMTRFASFKRPSLTHRIYMLLALIGKL